MNNQSFLKEIKNWSKIPFDKSRGIYQVVDNLMERNPERVLFRFKKVAWELEQIGTEGVNSQLWESLTVREFDQEVRKCASWLLVQGLVSGDQVLIFAENQKNWVLFDFACIFLGLVSVPIFPEMSKEGLKGILGRHDFKLAFVDSPERFKLLKETNPKINVQIFSEIKLPETINPTKLTEFNQKVTSEKIWTIVYTSGSTGKPKGVVLQHQTVLTSYQELPKSFPHNKLSEKLLVNLPLSHIFGRQVLVIFMNLGLVNISSAKTPIEDMQTLQPQYFASIPYFYDKVLREFFKNVPDDKKKLFKHAFKTAVHFSELKDYQLHNKSQFIGNLRRFLMLPKIWFYDLIFFRKIRNLLGGSVKLSIQAGGQLDSNIIHFYRTCKMNILGAYGSTETCGGISVNFYNHERIGSVGFPIPHCEVKIDNQEQSTDGELLVKGTFLFKEYYQDETLTQAKFTQDGYYRTGDLAKIDSDGSIWLLGRNSNIIVNSTGLKMNPEILEQKLLEHRLIEHVLILGNDQPYISALFTINQTELKHFLATQSNSSISKTVSAPSSLNIEAQESLTSEILQIVQPKIQEIVDQINSQLMNWEQIKKFAIVDNWTIENGLLNPTYKPIKDKIFKKYEDRINQFYQNSKVDF